VTCNRRALFPRTNARLSYRALLFGLASLVVFSSFPTQARDEQKDPRKSYALIVGTVWGPDDRPVYGVKVKIRRADRKKAKWELYSNHTGEFAQRLPAGKADYIVWVDTKGLKSLTGKKLDKGSEVTVHIESEERADIGLHLKEVKE
jgi:hypothetical protein